MESVSLLEILVAVLAPIIVWGVNRLAKASFAEQHERDLGTSVVAAVHEVKDTFLADLEGARDPSSPGGVKVTKEEKEEAKSRALALVMKSLKGPGLKYAQGRGLDFIRGLIGRYLDKWISGDDEPESGTEQVGFVTIDPSGSSTTKA